MKNFIALLLIMVAAFFCYNKYFRTPDTVRQKPSAALVAYADPGYDLYARLDKGMGVATRQDIQKLEASFREAMTKQPGSDRIIYQDAIIVCQALNNVFSERETYLNKLAALHADPNSVILATDRSMEGTARRQFFDEALERRWANTAKDLQMRVKILHSSLQKAEQDTGFAVTIEGQHQSLMDTIAAFFGKA